MERYLPTGNAFLSLPKINEKTAGIEDLTFLSMQHKGMIEIRGGEKLPLASSFPTGRRASAALDANAMEPGFLLASGAEGKSRGH